MTILSSNSIAFGADGHRIISLIAEKHLSVKTAQAIDAMTADSDLSQLSLWPDKIRHLPEWKHTKYWHYINIDDDEHFETLKRSSKGDLLSALDQAYQQLQNTDLANRERRQALSFFIHFVGDIHQPLHVGRLDDRGGNTLRLKWPKKTKTYNLHWVWDSGLINTKDVSAKDYARLLDRATKIQIQRWQQDRFLDWAIESKTLRSQVYEFGLTTAVNGQQPITISQDYIHRNRPIIEKRLLMAGIRLAGSLNQLFDPQK